MISNTFVSFGPLPDVQQRRSTGRNMDVEMTSQRDMYLQTGAFLTATWRAFNSSMKFTLFIL